MLSAKEERAAIVAWLCGEARRAKARAALIPQKAEENKAVYYACRSLARCIERGDHITADMAIRAAEDTPNDVSSVSREGST